MANKTIASNVVEMLPTTTVRCACLYVDRPHTSVSVCEHLALEAIEKFENGEDDGCEYIQHLHIHCNICNQTYRVRILVN